MLVFRFYFICFAGLIATLAFATGNGSPRQSSEKHEPPSGTKDSITFSSVHVDEPYIALTFDDGPSAIGIRPTLLRPPYGSITAREKRWIQDEFGYRIILWDVDPYDWKRPGPAVVRNRILKETLRGSIVLSHDIHPGTIEAMPSTLDALEAKGFKFVTVSELPRMATPQHSHTAPSSERISTN